MSLNAADQLRELNTKRQHCNVSPGVMRNGGGNKP